MVRYNITGRVVWHVRLLLCQVSVYMWIIATPDFDTYLEDYDPTNTTDVLSASLFADGREAPDGIEPASIYDFSAPVTGAAFVQLLHIAGELARKECRRLGLPFPFVPEAAPEIADRRGGDRDSLGARVDPRDLGDLIDNVDTRPPLAPPAITDPRILPVVYDRNGKRFRDYRSAVEALLYTDSADYPVKGPSTILWVAQFMLDNAGTPKQWHVRWRANCRLQPTDGGVPIHEAMCEIFETMLTFDQLNAASLASGELVVRQIQMQEDRWKERLLGTQADSTLESHLFVGSSSRGMLCVCPALEEWIAEETRKSSAILKERRKAREERDAARPKAKSGAKDGTGG